MKLIPFLTFFLTINILSFSKQQKISTNTEHIFTHIYETNMWGNTESVSGDGSTEKQTISLRNYLLDMVKRLNVKTMLDAPCGDFNWMKLIINDLNLDTYIGVDVVKELIKNNQELYATETTIFDTVDIIQDELPIVDLIICRDCFIHLSNADIMAELKNFQKSGSTYILTTHFTANHRNTNISTGSWQPLNLQKAPFNFPEPIEIINEKYPKPHTDKSMALWKLKDLPLD